MWPGPAKAIIGGTVGCTGPTASKGTLLLEAETVSTTPSKDNLLWAGGALGVTSNRVGIGAVSWLGTRAVVGSVMVVVMAEDLGVQRYSNCSGSGTGSCRL